MIMLLRKDASDHQVLYKLDRPRVLDDIHKEYINT